MDETKGTSAAAAAQDETKTDAATIDPSTLTNKAEISEGDPAESSPTVHVDQNPTRAQDVDERAPTSSVEASNQSALTEENAGKIFDDSRDNEPASSEGFTSMRHWLNTRIRQRERRVTMDYAGQRRHVTEITPDGRIRLVFGEERTLIPLDERYIPTLLEQLL